MAAVQAHDKPLKAKVRETERLAAFQEHLEQLTRHGTDIQTTALATICSQVLFLEQARPSPDTGLLCTAAESPWV